MSPLDITQPLGIWSINVYNGYYKVMSNIPKMGHFPTPVVIFKTRHDSTRPEAGHDDLPSGATSFERSGPGRAGDYAASASYPRLEPLRNVSRTSISAKCLVSLVSQKKWTNMDKLCG